MLKTRKGGADLKASQLNTEGENRLIAAAALGDRQAFAGLVELYEKFVYNTVKLKLGGERDAEDVCQDVFVKVWKSVPLYRGDCRFTTWLYKICQNACLDHLRREQHQINDGIPVQVGKDGDECEIEIADTSRDSCPQEMLEKNEAVRAVRRAISDLSPEQREVVELRDICGYSYEEISEMLGIEIGTVKSRLNRARANLKQKLSFMYAERNF